MVREEEKVECECQYQQWMWFGLCDLGKVEHEMAVQGKARVGKARLGRGWNHSALG